MDKIIAHLKKGIEAISNLLWLHEEHIEFSDEDLSNAVNIYAEVLYCKMFTYQRLKGLTQSQMESLADDIGKNIRQQVLLATGVDTYNYDDNIMKGDNANE